MNTFSFFIRYSLLFLSLFYFNISALTAQHKKNIDFYELDVNHGKLFQPNTIKPYTGTAHEKYADGRKKKRIPIKDGQVHGKVTEWEMNGQKISELNYVAGKPQGKESQWYESGKKKLEANYTNGVVNGVVTEWYENGKKKSEGQFNNGIETGVHNWWYSNGASDQLITYQNGKANGLVKHWHFNGQLKLEGNFKDGKENGDFTEWHPNGQIEMTGNYILGEKNDTFNIYSKNGLIQEIEIYDNGSLLKAFNYRSGNINWDKGYTQVFNSKESFYTINVLGGTVYPRTSTRDIIYVVDRYFLQLINTPVSLFTKTEISNNSDDNILKKFVSFESKYIEEKSEQKIDVTATSGTTKNGVPFIHWHFKPQLAEGEIVTPRTVMEEHYISLDCGQEVLSLYGLVTKVNKSEAVVDMLTRVADSVKIHNERIELNALNRTLHQK